MTLRLGLLGFSGSLLAGHLLRFVPAFRHGMSVALALLLVAVAIGACAGIAAMYIKRPHLRRCDWLMGAFPAVAAGLGIIALVAIGASL